LQIGGLLGSQFSREFVSSNLPQIDHFSKPLRPYTAPKKSTDKNLPLPVHKSLDVLFGKNIQAD
jgi:hypothetical protein